MQIQQMQDLQEEFARKLVREGASAEDLGKLSDQMHKLLQDLITLQASITQQSEADATRAVREEHHKWMDERVRSATLWLSALIVSGLGIAICGFWLWFTRLQVHLDREVRARLSSRQRQKSD